MFQKFSGSEKIYGQEGGGIIRISFRKIFVQQCRKKFVGRPFRESVIAGIEKCYASESFVTIFRRKIFVSQHRNTSWRNPSMLCFRKIPVAKKFLDKREWETSRFPLKFFVSKCQKMPKGNPLVFH